MDGLRGFASLRTPSSALPVMDAPPKHHCTRCGAVLRPSNPTDTCAPCDRGEIDIPEWAIAIIEDDPTPGNVATIASLLTGESKWARNDSRNTIIVEQYLAGESQGELAAAYGITRTAVQDLLRRRKVTRKVGGE